MNNALELRFREETASNEKLKAEVSELRLELMAAEEELSQKLKLKNEL